MRTTPISFISLYFRLGGKMLLGGIAICALALIAAFAFTGGQAEQLAADRVETTAVVFEAENFWDTTNIRDSRTGTFQSIRASDVSFRFETNDGAEIEGGHRFRGITQDIEVGMTFPIWYSASSPDTFELSVGHKERNSNAVRWVTGFFAALLGGFLIFGTFSSTRNILRIRDTGREREATVIEPTKNQIKHHHLGDHLHWQVKGLKPAHSRYPVAETERPSIGETISVYMLEDEAIWAGEFGPAQR